MLQLLILGLLFFSNHVFAQTVGGGTHMPSNTNYLFATFKQGTSKPLIIYKGDGVNWGNWTTTYTPCNAGGFVRDPSIAWYAPTRTMYLVHTNVGGVGTQNTTFDLASSTDGHTFTCIQAVDVSAAVSGAQAAVWMSGFVQNSDGSLYIDGSGFLHVFFNGSNTGTLGTQFKEYETHPISMSNLAGAWSAPVEITGTGIPTNLFFGFPQVVGSNINIWTSAGSAQNIIQEISTSLASFTSGYTMTQTLVGGSSFPTFIEGLTGLYLSGIGQPNRFRAYFSTVTGLANGEYYSESDDNGVTWTTAGPTASPVKVQNGTVIPNPGLN